MKSNKLVVAYKAYVVSGLAFDEALESELGNKDYLPDSTIDRLAEAHAEAYGEKYRTTIFYRLTNTGRYAFFTDEECTEAHEACKKQWQRTIGKYHKVAPSKRATTVKQVDKVAKRAESIKADFSKTEIKRLIKLLSV